MAKTALDKAALEADDIAAIGITNQRETTIVMEAQIKRYSGQKFLCLGG